MNAFPLDYLAGVANQGWGFDVVGTVGLTTPDMEIPNHRREANTRLLRKAANKYSRTLNSFGTKRPGLKSLIVFHASWGAISQVESVSPADFRYWTEKGCLSPSAKYYGRARQSIIPGYRKDDREGANQQDQEGPKSSIERSNSKLGSQDAQ